MEASPTFLVNGMPTYDYRCENCGNEFSYTKTMAERAATPVNCPKCDSNTVERLFSEFFAKTTRKS